MSARTGKDLNARRHSLRVWLMLFFLALAIPAALLMWQAYDRLKWQALHQYRLQAEEMTHRIDARLQAWIDREEQRPFTEYSFLNVAGDPQAGFVQRSPLARFPLDSDWPGLIGHFQVDGAGRLTSPLLPEAPAAEYGIPDAEWSARSRQLATMHAILADEREVQAVGSAVQAKPAAEPVARQRARQEERVASKSVQQVFEQLEQDIELDAVHSYAAAPAPAEAAPMIAESADVASEALADGSDSGSPYQRGRRVERNVLPAQIPTTADIDDRRPIDTFQSEIDAFVLQRLPSGHLVLYRKVWRDGERIIQGLLLDAEDFVAGLINPVLNGSRLAQSSRLRVQFRQQPLITLPADPGGGYRATLPSPPATSLYRARLGAPAGDLQLEYTLHRIPETPGGALLLWVSVGFILVLCAGLLLLYRLGVSQLRLARQQQNFVSAVSHELKTPLTSIRMYAEMLREGWAPEPKRAEYYDFIHSESERLSRLIGNVLDLARIERGELSTQMVERGPCELLDGIRSRIDSQLLQYGFQADFDCSEEVSACRVQVDVDHFTQILLNLVDNALKFAADAEPRRIDVRCRMEKAGELVFAVRDYGPGVAADQRDIIFRLFRRSENELTRKTKGTGIGLALARQLAEAMGGSLQVINREPGAEFQLRLRETASS